MAYEFDYQGQKGALGLGFQPEGMKWGGGAPPPGYIPNTRPRALGIPFKEGGGTSPSAFNYGNRIDQAVMSPYGAPKTITEAVLPTPNFSAPKPKFKNTNEIADHAFNTVFNPSPAPTPAMVLPTGSGYAMVGGQRVNYADIGTKDDPLSKGSTGGWAMGTGGGSPNGYGGAMNLPADPNMGLAVQDAQRRQSALDMSGVGAGGSYPRTLESRLRGIQGGGEGALLEAIVQSKIAKSENRMFDKNRNYAMNMENMQADNNVNRGVLQLQRDYLDLRRSALPSEIALQQGQTALQQAQIDRTRWEMTPEGVAAKHGNQGNPALESGMNQAIHGAKNPMEVARNQRWYALQTSGQGYEAPETTYQFNDGQGGTRSYKMYGMLHRDQYPAYHDTVKFLSDATNAYNNSRKSEKDLAMLQQARAAAVNKYRSLGLAFEEVDPAKAIAATPTE